jgi:hypothetical protein
MLFMKNNLFVKVFVMFLFCAMFGITANAQNTFSKGDRVVNIGLGVGSTYTTYTSSAIPISGSYEFGIKDDLFDDKSSLGVGAYLGFASSDRWNYTYLGVKGAVHYQFVEKLDTYAGLMLTMRLISGHGHSHNDLILPFFIGGRYYFTDTVGAFAEIGHGIAYLQLGVAIKF